MTAVRVPLMRRPSRLAGRLATVGALAAAAGLVLGRPELIVVAVPSLAALAAGRRARPGELTVVASTAADRYVEGDRVEVDVTIDPGPAGGGMRAELVLPAAAWDGSGTFATTGRREERWLVGAAEAMGPAQPGSGPADGMGIVPARRGDRGGDPRPHRRPPARRVGPAPAPAPATGPARRSACRSRGGRRRRVRRCQALRAWRRCAACPLACDGSPGTSAPDQACGRTRGGRRRRHRRDHRCRRHPRPRRPGGRWRRTGVPRRW